MRRNAVAALFAAGCLTKPPAAPPDAAGDGGPDPCTAGPMVIDDFDLPTAAPCGSGIAIGGVVALDSNELELVPMATTDSGPPPFTAGCSWSGVPLGGNGVEIENLTALTSSVGDDTSLQISDGTFAVTIHAVATVSGPMLELADSNDLVLTDTAYSSGSQWWRLRALDAHTYVGEYASDDTGTWHLLGTSSAVMTAAAVTVSVTATQGTASPGTASFDNVRACAQ